MIIQVKSECILQSMLCYEGHGIVELPMCVNSKITVIQIRSSLLQWTHVTNIQLTRVSMLEEDRGLDGKLL